MGGRKEVVVQWLNRVQLFVNPWTAVHQASLSFTIFRSLLRLVSTGSVMPSNHLTLCHPFLLLPSVFPSITVFSNKSALGIRWPKYWSISFIIHTSNVYSGLISFGIDWFDLQSQRKAIPKNVQTTGQLHSLYILARSCSKSFKLGFSST